MPAAAFAAAVSVILCAVPGVRVSVDGLAVTPVGSPLRDTFTTPVNPFRAVAFRDTVCPATPAVRLRVVGEAVRLKSGLAEGAVDRLFEACVPQPVSSHAPIALRTMTNNAGTLRMKIPSCRPLSIHDNTNTCRPEPHHNEDTIARPSSVVMRQTA